VSYEPGDLTAGVVLESLTRSLGRAPHSLLLLDGDTAVPSALPLAQCGARLRAVDRDTRRTLTLHFGGDRKTVLLGAASAGTLRSLLDRVCRERGLPAAACTLAAPDGAVLSSDQLDTPLSTLPWSALTVLGPA
jgi:hypothetical protein